mmetsp:Transcript_91150/g.260281  ORF Transcript_91150/g.260281 Transcript_91150/m.260281 type:complete len:202 (-) Transcript_91150:1207-1812(-)
MTPPCICGGVGSGIGGSPRAIVRPVPCSVAVVREHDHGVGVVPPLGPRAPVTERRESGVGVEIFADRLRIGRVAGAVEDVGVVLRARQINVALGVRHTAVPQRARQRVAPQHDVALKDVIARIVDLPYDLNLPVLVGRVRSVHEHVVRHHVVVPVMVEYARSLGVHNDVRVQSIPTGLVVKVHPEAHVRRDQLPARFAVSA